MFGKPLISPGPPKLECSKQKKVLGPVHHKSTARWMQYGTLRHYGSFLGKQIKSRSKVKITPLHNILKEERGWECPFGAPDMGRWEKWHIALKDTITRDGHIDPAILRECRDAFVNDIIKGLTAANVDKT